MPIVRQLRETYPWIAGSLTAMAASTKKRRDDPQNQKADPREPASTASPRADGSMKIKDERHRSRASSSRRCARRR